MKTQRRCWWAAAVMECKWGRDQRGSREGMLGGLQGPKWKERDGKSAILIRLSSMIVISNWLTAFVVDRQTRGVVCRLTAASLEERLVVTQEQENSQVITNILNNCRSCGWFQKRSKTIKNTK